MRNLYVVIPKKQFQVLIGRLVTGMNKVHDLRMVNIVSSPYR